MPELIITRKANQSFTIGENVRVRIKEIRAGGEISIAITAPAEIKILRDNCKNAVIVRDSRFRVRQSQMTGNWYAVDEITKMYLHDDGQLKIEAVEDDGTTGYYPTPDAAWEAAAKFEEANR